MSIKVISLILIAFLARNCYKYIINYKSVDFDNNYITPMFMRKEGSARISLARGRLGFMPLKIRCDLKNRMLEENDKAKLLSSHSGIFCNYVIE